MVHVNLIVFSIGVQNKATACGKALTCLVHTIPNLHSAFLPRSHNGNPFVMIDVSV